MLILVAVEYFPKLIKFNPFMKLLFISHCASLLLFLAYLNAYFTSNYLLFALSIISFQFLLKSFYILFCHSKGFNIQYLALILIDFSISAIIFNCIYFFFRNDEQMGVAFKGIDIFLFAFFLFAAGGVIDFNIWYHS